MVTPASEGASAAGSGAVEMQRDTSREDELKRMTQAWETEQPGRLQKVRVPIKPLASYPDPISIPNSDKSWIGNRDWVRGYLYPLPDCKVAQVMSSIIHLQCNDKSPASLIYLHTYQMQCHRWHMPYTYVHICYRWHNYMYVYGYTLLSHSGSI